MQKIFASILAAGMLAGCSPSSDLPADSAESGLKVSASFYPLAFVAERVGGARATVESIVPAGAEPHEYEPTPRQIAGLYESGVVLFHGLEMDPWAERLAPELQKSGVKTVEATAGLPLRRASDSAGFEPAGDSHGEAGHDHEAEADHHAAESGHAHESEFDPHVWLDPSLLSMIADRAAEAFVVADPAHAADYQANAAQLKTELAVLDAEFKSGLANCSTKKIIASHDAFGYLGARYGFTVLPVAGLSPDAEPSPAALARLAQLARAENIQFVTFETLTSPKMAETLAREIGAQALMLNPVEGLTPDQLAAGEDYFSQMRANLATLRTAMNCSSR